VVSLGIGTGHCSTSKKGRADSQLLLFFHLGAQSLSIYLACCPTPTKPSSSLSDATLYLANQDNVHVFKITMAGLLCVELS
jgi:hypothetical protein